LIIFGASTYCGPFPEYRDNDFHPAISSGTAYADVVVGGVLVPGQRAPILVTRHGEAMKPRSVIMDVSIDEGCVETSRPTTHEHPVR
jgi:alanine dehydrogenase